MRRLRGEGVVECARERIFATGACEVEPEGARGVREVDAGWREEKAAHGGARYGIGQRQVFEDATAVVVDDDDGQRPCGVARGGQPAQVVQRGDVAKEQAHRTACGAAHARGSRYHAIDSAHAALKHDA